MMIKNANKNIQMTELSRMSDIWAFWRHLLDRVDIIFILVQMFGCSRALLCQ